ncbi:hypothetical protein A9O66_14380 [Paraburkholderia caribensis]|uniref:Uncharacterized protein n=1 Tax=Paraburkholderia caribensis TaxID=75105 RepID=A0A9Q6S3J0_9BURK|nr:hypothetical protein A9O66_14380 [Paraburkholderia caribensis]
MRILPFDGHPIREIFFERFRRDVRVAMVVERVFLAPPAAIAKKAYSKLIEAIPWRPSPFK